MSTNADHRPPAVDLSGFDKRASTVPPPPLVPPPGDEGPGDEAPPAPAPRRRSESRPRRSGAPARQPATGAAPKVQFFVHLPAEQHGWLREQAQARGWPKREVILEAFLNHRDELPGHDAEVERRAAAGLPPRAPGRRKEVGGIPSNVYMGRNEAEVLDRHAQELGMSRSQMVAELLALAAGPTPKRRASRTAGT